MYKVAENHIVRASDGAFIPKDPSNMDYLKYLDWVSKGNTAPPDEPPPLTYKERRTKIDVERDEKLKAGVKWGVDDLLFHSDDQFLTELLGMLMAYSAGVYTPEMKQDIRTKNNKIIQLGQSDLVSLAAAVGQHRKSVYAWSWAQKDALVESLGIEAGHES